MTGVQTCALRSVADVFEVLEREGVEKFTASWSELTTTVRDQLDAAK